MTNSEMKKAIRGMAEQLAEHVVKLLGSATLKELVALSEGTKRPGTPALPAPSKPKAQLPAATGTPATAAKTKAKPSKSKASKPKASKSKAKPSKSKAKPAPARPTVDGIAHEIQEVLRKNGDYMKGAAILSALSAKPTSELLGRVLRNLMVRGLVTKKGLTRNSEYRLAAFSK